MSNSVEIFWHPTFFLAFVACPTASKSFGNQPSFSLLLLVRGGAHLFHAAFLSNPRKCSVQTREHAGPSPSAWNDFCHFFSPFAGRSQSHAHICSMWWGLQSLVGGAASILRFSLNIFHTWNTNFLRIRSSRCAQTLLKSSPFFAHLGSSGAEELMLLSPVLHDSCWFYR